MKRGRPRHDDILTPREWQVLALLAERRTNPEIAAALGITTDGVKYHVSQILAKLGVESRDEAGRLYRTHRPKQLALLPPLAWLRSLLPKSGAAMALLGGSVALVVLVVLLISSSDGSSRAATPVDDPSEAVGLDVPPEEQQGAANDPAPSLPNTLLLTKGTPANTGSGAATIAAMRRVSSLAELEAALTDSTKLIVIDRSAVDEVRGSNVLRQLIESRRIVAGLNVSTDEIAKLADFTDIVRAGCPVDCPNYPGIREPSMPERGFYSFLFYDSSEAISPSRIGQYQKYFFEGLFRDEVIDLDSGHYADRVTGTMAAADIPTERISVNRGMGCTYNDAKVAGAAKREAMKVVTEPIFGMSVFACNAQAGGMVEIRVLLHRPTVVPTPSPPCVSTSTVSPNPACSPALITGGSIPPLVVTVPVSEITP